RDVGRLVDLLRELQIAEDTLVLFTSDNGPHHEGGHKVGFFDSNGPLRGHKRDLYEGGIRVPLIAWWPGKVEAGTISDHLSAFWDFLPTVCELAEVPVPEGIDGISYAPELLGRDQPAHEFLYWQYRDNRAVRQGDWKLVRTGKRKPLELYNLSTDIGEQTDLASKHPDKVRSMAALLDE